MKERTKKGLGQTKTEQQEMREFFAKYQKLCKEDGYRLVITPAFQARDDGTWSVVLQTSVGKLPNVTKK